MKDGDRDKMEIFIPTRGRPFNQKTAMALMEAGVEFWLVCSKNDPTLSEYKSLWSGQVSIVDAKGLSDKMQKIVDYATTSKILLLDDDLTFYERDHRTGKFSKLVPKHVVTMIKWFKFALKDYAHVGLVDKFMSQNRPLGEIHQGRYNQVRGYNLALFPKPRPKFRLPLNQEHDMHLQLLSQGLVPCISCMYSKDAKYYAAGGLTHMRTPALEMDVFNRLQNYWPNYVKLRDTKYSISGWAATFNWRRATKERKNAHLYPDIPAG